MNKLIHISANVAQVVQPNESDNLAGRILVYTENYGGFPYGYIRIGNEKCIKEVWDPIEIYFYTNDTIVPGDWCLLVDQYGNVMFGNPQKYDPLKGHGIFKGLKKVIATTNTSLGLPIISPAWITEVYVPNQGKIVNVQVEKLLIDYDEFNQDYKGSVLNTPIRDGVIPISFTIRTVNIKDKATAFSLDFNSVGDKNVAKQSFIEGAAWQKTQTPWTNKDMTDFADWLHKLELKDHERLTEENKGFLTIQDYLTIWENNNKI